MKPLDIHYRTLQNEDLPGLLTLNETHAKNDPHYQSEDLAYYQSRLCDLLMLRSEDKRNRTAEA